MHRKKWCHVPFSVSTQSKMVRGTIFLLPEEIEVDALVGLGHRVEEELEVAALGARLAHRTRVLALRELGVGDQQRELALLDVEADAIAGLYPCERAADRGFRRHM